MYIAPPHVRVHVWKLHPWEIRGISLTFFSPYELHLTAIFFCRAVGPRLRPRQKKEKEEKEWGYSREECPGGTKDGWDLRTNSSPLNCRETERRTWRTPETIASSIKTRDTRSSRIWNEPPDFLVLVRVSSESEANTGSGIIRVFGRDNKHILLGFHLLILRFPFPARICWASPVRQTDVDLCRKPSRPYIWWYEK